MLHVSYDNERRLQEQTRVKVAEVFKKFGVDEEKNSINPTDDRNFIDNVVYNLLLMAKSYSNSWTIPEDWQLDPKVSQALGRSEIDQRVDTSLLQGLYASGGYKAKEFVQKGDLLKTTQELGLSNVVVASKLILDKDPEFVDGYYEVRAIFELLLEELKAASAE